MSTPTYPAFSKKASESLFLQLTDNDGILSGLEDAQSNDPRILLSRFVQWAEFVAERIRVVDESGVSMLLSKGSIKTVSVWPAGFPSLRSLHRWVSYASTGDGLLSTVDLVASDGSPKESSVLSPVSSSDFNSAMEAYTGETAQGTRISDNPLAGRVIDGATFSAAVLASCGQDFARAYVRKQGDSYSLIDDGWYRAEISYETTQSTTAYTTETAKGNPDDNGDIVLDTSISDNPHTTDHPAESETLGDWFHDDPATLNVSNSHIDPLTVYDLDWKDVDALTYAAVTDYTDENWHPAPEEYDELNDAYYTPYWYARNIGAHTVTTTDHHTCREYVIPSFSWKFKIKMLASAPQQGQPSAADLARTVFPVSEPWYVRVRTESVTRKFRRDENGELIFGYSDYNGNTHHAFIRDSDTTTTYKALQLNMAGSSWSDDSTDPTYASITLRVSKSELFSMIDRVVFTDEAEASYYDNLNEYRTMHSELSGYDGSAYLDYQTVYVPYVPRQRLVEPSQPL